MNLLHVVGGERGFLRIAPVYRALEEAGDVRQTLVRAGTAAGEGDGDFVREWAERLRIPAPEVCPGGGGASPVLRTARALISLEPLVKRVRPTWIVAVGDADCVLAAALLAAKRNIPLAHIGAGIRSGDLSTPRELNRILTDRIAGLLFAPDATARDNLLAEGIPEVRVHHVGNVLIDTLDELLEEAVSLRMPDAVGLESRGYVVACVENEADVEQRSRLGAILTALAQVEAECGLPVLWPLRPHAAGIIRRFGLESELSGVHLVERLSYPEYLGLVADAAVVITDVDAVQEETTVLGVPCITLGARTGRPVTVQRGTNRLFEGDLIELADSVRRAAAEERRGHRPELWDGEAGRRIAAVLLEQAGATPAPEPLAAGEA